MIKKNTKRNLKRLIKDLYIKDGLAIEDICVRLSCDRSTFYYHKNNDKKTGTDWDELKAKREYNNISSVENYEENKQKFLSSLFAAWEKEKDEIEKIEDPIARVDILKSFTNNYYKFLKPSVHDCKGVADKAARTTLNIIIDFAIKYDKRDLIDFLNDNFEEITTKTVDQIKRLK